jgi:hypothetical protein
MVVLTFAGEMNRVKKYHQNRLLLLLILGLFPTVAAANTIIPAPLVWLGITDADSVFRYILSVTLVCVGVEAAIYKYYPQFKHPIRDSVVANAVSTVFGIPLAFVGAMMGDPFIIATVLSVIIEYIVIERMETKNGTEPCRSIIWPVFLANLVSNAMIFVLLMWKSGALERE